MDEKMRRVRKEVDYINIKRYNFSLKEMMKSHPSGCPVALQARALILDEDEIPELMAKIIAKIRRTIMTEAELAKIEKKLKMELIENIRNYLVMVQNRSDHTPQEKKMIKAGELFLETLSQNTSTKERKSDD